MILNNAPQHEAVLSNVGEIGEFRIRNSAKAFNILSSGLYANKIRAIIRELSCNAVDSHTAAGKSDVPFDVHLPNQLDPTFRIRDYGVGLSHEQVLNIYTTYFESTKTESNQFIGALGLGSKSPFSYTDNFTVTAIKDGTRNVYSAFINGEGVPSVALMHSEASTEDNGVEVQFAVTDRWDYDKFYSEAREVYTYFALRPNVSGGEREFNFRDVEYKDRNIVPGVHYIGRCGSRAIMGNISYPIDIPNAETNLGELRRLLACGLEMHFDIGELDFQASREGLSYIPQTINAIKAKLEAVNQQLGTNLALEANIITNAWEKVYFLQRRAHEDLWAAATREYIVSHHVTLLDNLQGNYIRLKDLGIEIQQLASRYNIVISAFSKQNSNLTCSDIKPHKNFKNGYGSSFEEEWRFSVSDSTIFVVNDLKVGALSRAKHHWRHAKSKGIALPSTAYHSQVYVLNAATKGHAMDISGFMAELHNPPTAQIVKASDLLEKERKDITSSRAKNVRILRLEPTNTYRNMTDVKWHEAGRADQYESTETYYYMPLSGYNVIDSKASPHTLYQQLRESGIEALQGIDIYGVRKGDIEWVRSQSNWVLLEDHVAKVLNSITPEVLSKLAISQLDNSKVFSYTKEVVNLVDSASPYRKYVEQLKDVQRDKFFRPSYLVRLCETYAPAVNYTVVNDSIKEQHAKICQRYPLLNCVTDYNMNALAVAEYISLIDNMKGI